MTQARVKLNVTRIPITGNGQNHCAAYCFASFMTQQFLEGKLTLQVEKQLCQVIANYRGIHALSSVTLKKDLLAHHTSPRQQQGVIGAALAYLVAVHDRSRPPEIQIIEPNGMMTPAVFGWLATYFGNINVKFYVKGPAGDVIPAAKATDPLQRELLQDVMLLPANAPTLQVYFTGNHFDRLVPQKEPEQLLATVVPEMKKAEKKFKAFMAQILVACHEPLSVKESKPSRPAHSTAIAQQIESDAALARQLQMEEFKNFKATGQFDANSADYQTAKQQLARRR